MSVCVCKRVMCPMLHLGSMGCQKIGQTILSKVMTVITIAVMALHLCVCASTIKGLPSLCCFLSTQTEARNPCHTAQLYIWMFKKDSVSKLLTLQLILDNMRAHMLLLGKYLSDIYLSKNCIKPGSYCSGQKT